MSPIDPFRRDPDGFVRGVIDGRQVLDDPPAGAAVEHEVHGQMALAVSDAQAAGGRPRGPACVSAVTPAGGTRYV